MNFSRRTRRRVVVQLAALVDLLFVVFFLQYAQMQRSAHHAIESRDSADKLKTSVLADQEKLRLERDDLHAKLQEMSRKLADSEARGIAAEKRAQVQVDQIAKTTQELFRGVDEKAVAEQMRGASGEQRAKIVDELKQAQGSSPAGIIQSLRKAAELQKRCDVWEVHLFADGRVRIRGPGVQDRMILPKDENDFSNQFMQIVGEAREPLSLVLILFTHGNAEARDLRAVSRGLEQVRTTWGSRVPASKSIQLAAPMYSEQAP